MSERARLFRRVPASVMPTPYTVAIYDREQEMILINDELFDALDASDQKRVYFMETDSIEADFIEAA